MSRILIEILLVPNLKNRAQATCSDGEGKGKGRGNGGRKGLCVFLHFRTLGDDTARRTQLFTAESKSDPTGMRIRGHIPPCWIYTCVCQEDAMAWSDTTSGPFSQDMGESEKFKISYSTIFLHLESFSLEPFTLHPPGSGCPSATDANRAVPIARGFAGFCGAARCLLRRGRLSQLLVKRQPAAAACDCIQTAEASCEADEVWSFAKASTTAADKAHKEDVEFKPRQMLGEVRCRDQGESARSGSHQWAQSFQQMTVTPQIVISQTMPCK